MTKKLALLFLCLSLSGCLPAAVAYTAYEVSNARERAAVTAAKANETASYAAYTTEMERINFDREKAGLKTKPVLSMEEWKSSMR